MRESRRSVLSASSDGKPCTDLLDNTDIKLQLSATDYGSFLANEPSPLATSTIAEKATAKLVDEFNYIRSNAEGDLARFLEYMTLVLSLCALCFQYLIWCSYAYMIDNVLSLRLFPSSYLISSRSFFSSLERFTKGIRMNSLNAVTPWESLTPCLHFVWQPTSKSSTTLCLSRLRLVRILFHYDSCP